MFDRTAVSRTRSASAAVTSPRPVQENDATATTASSGSHAPTGKPTRSSSAPTDQREHRRPPNPLTMTGSDRPRNSGSRRAGMASSSARVC